MVSDYNMYSVLYNIDKEFPTKSVSVTSSTTSVQSSTGAEGNLLMMKL